MKNWCVKKFFCQREEFFSLHLKIQNLYKLKKNSLERTRNRSKMVNKKVYVCVVLAIVFARLPSGRCAISYSNRHEEILGCAEENMVFAINYQQYQKRQKLFLFRDKEQRRIAESNGPCELLVILIDWKNNWCWSIFWHRKNKRKDFLILFAIIIYETYNRSLG